MDKQPTYYRDLKTIYENSEERERFKIEAKAAASLNHPNIAINVNTPGDKYEQEADNPLFLTNFLQFCCLFVTR